MNWTEIFIYGHRTALEAWIEAKKIEDDNGDRHLPHGILVRGPIFPQEQTGVDAEGNPTYARKTGAVKCLWLFCLYDSEISLLDEVKVLNGPYTIRENTSISEINVLYPNHCLGQAIPHLARII